MGMYMCNICGSNVYEDSFYGQIILYKQETHKKRETHKIGDQSSETITYNVCRHCFDEVERSIKRLAVEKKRSKND